jgi:hypothetical protein
VIDIPGSLDHLSARGKKAAVETVAISGVADHVRACEAHRRREAKVSLTFVISAI